MSHRIIVISALGFVLISCSTASDREVPGANPYPNRVQAYLDRTMIPEVSLKGVPVEEAVSLWVESVRRFSPDGRGCSVVMRLGTTPDQGLPAMPGANAPDKVVPPLDPDEPSPRVTISGKNMNARQLLNEICKQAGAYWRIERKCIVITNNRRVATPKS